MEWYNVSIGLFEELIEFAMLSKKQTVIYFDNCQMWLGKETINANNLFIGYVILCNPCTFGAVG